MNQSYEIDNLQFEASESCLNSLSKTKAQYFQNSHLSSSLEVSKTNSNDNPMTSLSKLNKKYKRKKLRDLNKIDALLYLLIKIENIEEEQSQHVLALNLNSLTKKSQQTLFVEDISYLKKPSEVIESLREPEDAFSKSISMLKHSIKIGRSISLNSSMFNAVVEDYIEDCQNELMYQLKHSAYNLRGKYYDNNNVDSDQDSKSIAYSSEFEFIQLLGKGAQGEVLKVRDQNGRFHAIKLYDKYKDEAAFFREACVFSKLNENDCGGEAGFSGAIETEQYYGLKFGSGICSLKEYRDFLRIKKIQLTENDILHILSRIITEMSYQQIGYSHRDLKLSNIVIFEDGYFEIIDYGLATISIEENLADRGTPGYLPSWYWDMKNGFSEIDLSQVDLILLDFHAISVIGLELAFPQFNILGFQEQERMKLISKLNYSSNILELLSSYERKNLTLAEIKLLYAENPIFSNVFNNGWDITSYFKDLRFLDFIKEFNSNILNLAPRKEISPSGIKNKEKRLQYFNKLALGCQFVREGNYEQALEEFKACEKIPLGLYLTYLCLGVTAFISGLQHSIIEKYLTSGFKVFGEFIYDYAEDYFSFVESIRLDSSLNPSEKVIFSSFETYEENFQYLSFTYSGVKIIPENEKNLFKTTYLNFGLIKAKIFLKSIDSNSRKKIEELFIELNAIKNDNFQIREIFDWFFSFYTFSKLIQDLQINIEKNNDYTNPLNQANTNPSTMFSKLKEISLKEFSKEDYFTFHQSESFVLTVGLMFLFKKSKQNFSKTLLLEKLKFVSSLSVNEDVVVFSRKNRFSDIVDNKEDPYGNIFLYTIPNNFHYKDDILVYKAVINVFSDPLTILSSNLDLKLQELYLRITDENLFNTDDIFTLLKSYDLRIFHMYLTFFVPFQDLEMKKLASVISDMKNIEIFSLYYSFEHLTDKGIIYLANVVQQLQKLKVFEFRLFGSSLITLRSLKILAQQLVNLINLEKIIFHFVACEKIWFSHCEKLQNIMKDKKNLIFEIYNEPIGFAMAKFYNPVKSIVYKNYKMYCGNEY